MKILMHIKFLALSLFITNSMLSKNYTIVNKAKTAVMAEIFDRAEFNEKPESDKNKLGVFGKALKGVKEALNINETESFAAAKPIGKFIIWPEYEKFTVKSEDSDKGFEITKNENPDPSRLIIDNLKINNNKNSIKNDTDKPKWVWLYGDLTGIRAAGRKEKTEDLYIGSWTTALAPGETRNFSTEGKKLRTIRVTSDPIETKIAENIDQNNSKGFEINQNYNVESIQTAKPQHVSPSDLTIMTLNCFSFNPTKAALLKTLKIADLHSGIDKNVHIRLNEIGTFVNLHEPDVFVAQEVWGDKNKMVLKEALNAVGKGDYDVRSVGNDDGLLLASKRPIEFFEAITFEDYKGDEKWASKGALFAGFKDYANKPVLVVNTHLQSQTDWDKVVTRHRQVYQIGQKIAQIVKNKPEYANARIFIVGDFNEPIYLSRGFIYKDNGGKAVKVDPNGLDLLDRAQYIVDTLAFSLGNSNLGKLKITNNEVINFLKNKYKPTQTVLIDEYKTEDPTHTSGAQITADGKETALDFPHFDYETEDEEMKNFSNAINERFRNWDSEKDNIYYFKDATEPQGIQLLDHFFVDKNDRLISYTTFRKELLGDTSNQLMEKFPDNYGQMTPDQRKEYLKKYYNPKVAMSDHAAVMATFRNETGVTQ